MIACPRCAAPNADKYIVCVSCGATAPTTMPGATNASGSRMREIVPEVIAGRFQIIEELGRGGMGLVFRALDRQLGEEVALKVVLPGLTREPGYAERLKREIITARRVTHPNVIRINEFGLAEDAFIAMELLRGGTLKDLIEKGPIPVVRGLEIAVGMCDGLAAAHEKGVIHRDLKPDNVLFDGDGTPKLVDFGLARLSTTTSHTVGFAGTPFYMSPEQAEGLEINSASDVYSMGVLLFELFTGKVPFHADSLVRIAVMHAHEAPPKPRSLRPDLPEMVENVLLAALQKSPDMRPSASALATDLSTCHRMLSSVSVRRPRPSNPGFVLDDAKTGIGVKGLPAEPITATGPGETASQQPKTSSTAPAPPPPPTPKLPSGSRSRSLPAAAIALVLLSLAAIGGWWKFGGRDSLPVPTPLVIAAIPTPTPTPTPTAEPTVESTAVVAAPTPTPTPAKTATPKKTPKTNATAVAAVTARPVGEGTLKVTSTSSPVEVWVDGKRVSRETPLRDHKISAGAHTLRFVNEALKYSEEYAVEVGADRLTHLHVDAVNGKIERR